jgi:hypothetical protein
MSIQTYLAIGGVGRDSILLSAVLAILQTEVTAMLIQSILLLSNALFLVLNLLDVGVSGILLQLENLLLEHLSLLSR